MPDARAVALFHHHRRRAGISLPVQREDVEVRHLIRIRARRARIDPPLAQQIDKVAVRPRLRVFARMNDEHPEQAERHLRHLIVMRVIHIGAVLPHGKLIPESLARLDRLLGQAADAIHAIGQDDAVPMDGRRRGQLVRHVNAQPVALHALDGRPVDLAVIAPALRAQALRYRPSSAQTRAQTSSQVRCMTFTPSTSFQGSVLPFSVTVGV